MGVMVNIHPKQNQFSLQRVAVQYHIQRMFVAFSFFHLKNLQEACSEDLINNGTNIRFFLSLMIFISFFFTTCYQRRLFDTVTGQISWFHVQLLFLWCLYGNAAQQVPRRG